MKNSTNYLQQFSDNSKKVVGARIRQCRLSMEPKMSAKDLVKQLEKLSVEGLVPSERTITKIETGLTTAPLPLLLALSEIFDCDAAWLAGLTQELSPAPSLAKIPYYRSKQHLTGQSLNHLTFKKSWLDSKGVDPDKLVLVLADASDGSKTYLLNTEQSTLTSDGYYGLIVNQECIIRYIRPLLSGSIALYANATDLMPLEEFSLEQLSDKLEILGSAFWVATEL